MNNNRFKHYFLFSENFLFVCALFKKKRIIRLKQIYIPTFIIIILSSLCDKTTIDRVVWLALTHEHNHCFPCVPQELQANHPCTIHDKFHPKKKNKTKRG